MHISFTEVSNHGAPLVVAIVPSEFTLPGNGLGLIDKIQRHMQTMPIMLVSIEDNGPRAYATFETHMLLALIQLENLFMTVLDLDALPPEEALPF